MIIVSERLSIREVNLEDTQSLFSYRSDKISNQYQGWIPETLQDAEVFITNAMGNWNKTGCWCQLCITTSENSMMIGDIGVHFIDEDQIELGITLAKEHQGKRYAEEALSVLIDSLLSLCNKHRVITSIDPRNHAAISLVERIGFRKEAHFRKNYRFKDAWADEYIYALLSEEWEDNTFVEEGYLFSEEAKGY